MYSEEIKKLGISSSQKYHEYLSEIDQGVVKINVTHIDKGRPMFKLRLDRKIHNLEMIEFKVSGDQISSDKINVIEYDRDNNVLTIKPSPNLQEQFEKLSSDEIKIISDLKFLIRRVEDWYKENGSEIALPSRGSYLNAPMDENFFHEMTPSSDQKFGIEAVFNSPLSYIWGAPGTGKTQLVLAYSLIHYIRAGKQVAIFAATNNALEQILYGVLKMTKEAGIEDSKILRLGTPSSKFAQRHPNSCETTGVQQKINEINNQIKIINNVIEHKALFEELKVIKDKSQKIFSQFKKVYIRKEEVRLSMKMIREDIPYAQYELNKLQLQILKLKKSIRKKEKIRSSFSYRLRRLFTKNIDLEIELKKENVKLYESKDENNIKENKVNILKGQYNKLKTERNDSSETVRLVKGLRVICASKESIEEIISDITLQNHQSIKNDLNVYIQECSETLNAEEYVRLTEQELSAKLQSLEFEKNNLELGSEETIENANVIALTLDCYIGRYKDKELPAEHYFLDEAGYASLIKALTLFRGDIPVTLLGDHMQLPPVCQMNDRYMQGDNKDVFMWAQSSLYAEWIFQKDHQESFLDYSERHPYIFSMTKKIDLLHTYRFGSALAGALDKFVYQNGFVAHDKIGETKIYYVDAQHTYPQPSSFFNGRESSSPSRENRPEGSKICELVSGFNKDSFVILTPYKDQVRLIGDMLPEARNNQQIMTVHGSQGREWDDVVLSIVDTDRMWFVDSLNRNSRGINVLNTAVSRARKRLFVICNYNFWIKQDRQLVKGLLDVAIPVKDTE